MKRSLIKVDWAPSTRRGVFDLETISKHFSDNLIDFIKETNRLEFWDCRGPFNLRDKSYKGVAQALNLHGAIMQVIKERQ